MGRSRDEDVSGKRVTLREVAREAGVSIGTASRVINEIDSVRFSHRQRVLEAIERLGYRPNAMAQSIRKPRTNLVGCIVRDINIHALADFVDASCNLLAEHGISMLISNSEGSVTRERKLLDRLEAQGCEGVIIGSYIRTEGADDDFHKDLRMPIVAVDRDRPAGSDAVMVDHRSATCDAMRGLLELGHREVLLITGDPELYPARERIRGFREACEGFGIAEIDRRIVARSFTAAEGFRTMSELLARDARPTAVVAGGIDMLTGVLAAIDAFGLRVPDDISLVAAGDSDLARLRSPAINVETWSQAEVGRIAARLLLDRIGGSTLPPQHVLVPAEYIQRGSVAPARS